MNLPPAHAVETLVKAALAQNPTQNPGLVDGQAQDALDEASGWPKWSDSSLPAAFRRPKKPQGRPEGIEEALHRARRARALADATPEELLPAVLPIAWRVARALVVQLGLCRGAGVPLRESTRGLMGGNPDPWNIPPNHQSWSGNTQWFNDLCRDALALNGRGLGISPANGDTPEDTQLRTLWCDAARRAWASRTIGRGDQLLTEVVTERLFDPDQCHLHWPSRLQVLSWEDRFVERCVADLARRGIVAFRNTLAQKHDLRPSEVEEVLSMVRAKALDMTKGDAQEWRAIMVLRLEDLAARARDALDVRGELQVLKQMSIVLGITRAKAQDVEAQFVDLTRKLDEEDRKRALDMQAGGFPPHPPHPQAP